MNNIIRQQIREAMETVVDIPEEYRKIAFEVILKHLLTHEVMVSKQVIPKQEENVEKNKFSQDYVLIRLYECR